MNWIKGKARAEVIRRDFLKKIIPVSNDLQKKQITFFPLRPDLKSPTYYRERGLISMTPEDFEVPGCESSEQLELALAELWNSQGYAELVPLAKTSARLAELLRDSEEENQDVSPFIYVMF